MASSSPNPDKLFRWEWWLLVIFLALCLFLAVAGKGRKQARIYDDFLGRAPLIHKALECFAHENQGRFPPDAMLTNRPQGLDDRYIAWSPYWLIDYEVHENGTGGWFVCLEFVGPYGDAEYHALCLDADLRANYGRGQPIPGRANRIWLVCEDAPIMPKLPGSPAAAR